MSIILESGSTLSLLFRFLENMPSEFAKVLPLLALEGPRSSFPAVTWGKFTIVDYRRVFV